MRRLMLLILYVAVVTPIGLLFRACHDPLHRRRRPGAATYWIHSSPQREEP